MSSSDVSLLQIPDIPMKHILEYLNFPSILVLRKVCHDLRNFIDDTKPASRLTKICINVNFKCIKFYLKSEAQSKIRIFYEKCNEGCLIKKCHKRKEIKRTILENEDFVEIFCKDFSIVLRHQKSVLEEFKIKFTFLGSRVQERVLESVSKVFEAMDHLLQVKSLHMEVDDNNEILSILSYFDPNPLVLIHISERYGMNPEDNIVLNLNEIGQLEQWKQAKELSIRGFQLPDLSQNFQNCSSIDLGYRGISIEELISFKEVFLRSSTLNMIKTSYNDHYGTVIEERLIEAFGQPFPDREWFFGIPDTIQFLKITHKPCFTQFDRIEQSDVPQNAIIFN